MIPSRDAIIDIIAEEARIDPDRLTPSATLASLDIASLDVMSIIFAIEDRFGVEIAPEDLAQAATLDEFVGIIMAKVSAA